MACRPQLHRGLEPRSPSAASAISTISVGGTHTSIQLHGPRTELLGVIEASYKSVSLQSLRSHSALWSLYILDALDSTDYTLASADLATLSEHVSESEVLRALY